MGNWEILPAGCLSSHLACQSTSGHLTPSLPSRTVSRHICLNFHTASRSEDLFDVDRRPCSDSRHVTAPYKSALYYYYYYYLFITNGVRAPSNNCFYYLMRKKNDGYCYYTASKRAVRCIAYLLFWSIKSAGQQMSCIFLQPDDGVRFSFVETAPVPAVPVFSVLYRKRQLPRAVFSSSLPAAIPCPRARCSIGRPTAPPQKIQCCCCWRDNMMRTMMTTGPRCKRL